jgi:hypothetical protein
MTGLLNSFVYAENLCTGSQGDQLSNCITENLRFLPYLDDKTEATVKDIGFIKAKQLPYLSGKTYVTLQPIGIANATAQMMQQNDYGVISFRCLEAFSRPMLSIPRLQDLGLLAKEINITETIIVEPTSVVTGGVPLRDITACLGDIWCIADAYLFNTRNLSLSYSTSIATVISGLEAIKKLINGTGDYYTLPSLASKVSTALASANTANSTVINQFDLAIAHVTSMPVTWDRTYLLDTFNSAKTLIVSSFDLATLNTSIQTNVVTPLSVITSATDFTIFDFNITDGVAVWITALDLSNSQQKIFSTQQLLGSWGTPPSYDPSVTNAKQYLIRNVAVMYIYEIFNAITYILDKVQVLYNVSNVSQTINEITEYEAKLAIYASYQDHSYSSIISQFTDITLSVDSISYGAKYTAALEVLNTLVTTFSTGTVKADILALDPALDTYRVSVETRIDAYWDAAGTSFKIQLSNMKTLIEDAIRVPSAIDLSGGGLATNPNTPTAVTYSASGEVMTLNLGYDFKDKNKYYFADVALAVGFGRLTQLHSIQIGEELYLAENMLDSAGNPVTGISEAGASKYTFTRNVLPTYSPVVQMYIYPGLPNQPYCPTVNAYNNFAVTKYSGMFTKLLPISAQNPTGSTMGLYVFTGYKPLEATVENIYQLGSIDINSINLNDPTIDDKSYEAMLQRQVVSLTNSNSLLRDGVITTDDLKYYFKAEIFDTTNTMSLSNLAIVEFINFPLGSSVKVPEIIMNFTVADPYPKA